MIGMDMQIGINMIDMALLRSNHVGSDESVDA